MRRRGYYDVQCAGLRFGERAVAEQDPMGFDAGDSNLYRYVNNSPMETTDPSGQDVWANGSPRLANAVLDWLGEGAYRDIYGLGKGLGIFPLRQVGRGGSIDRLYLSGNESKEKALAALKDAKLFEGEAGPVKKAILTALVFSDKLQIGLECRRRVQE